MILLRSQLWLILALLPLFVPTSASNYAFGQVCDTYRSFALGITIDLPCGWKANEENEVVSLVSPDEGSTDRILESVDASIYPTFGLTLTDFARFLTTGFYPSSLGSSFKVLEDTTRTINGRETGLIVYEYFDKELRVPLQAMDVFFQEGDFFYQLTFTADKNSYLSYLPVIKPIIESFEVISSPTGSTDSESSDLTGGIGK